MKKIRTLVVDDSPFIRKMFTEILNSDPTIEVIDTAEDPYDAREKIKALNPDVITLDIEMPKMDGLSFLQKIMSLRPMPVVMASSLTAEGAEATIKALEIGAVDHIQKSSSNSFDMEELSDNLIMKVKAAAKAKVNSQEGWGIFGKLKPINIGSIKKNKIIAIGASTGGVEALRSIITLMPENCPPILITQHMPERFTATFAERLDKLSHAKIQEATDGQKVEAGNVYIAPGNKHLELVRKTNGLTCRVKDGENVSGHKPSVDVLFESVASFAGTNAVGVMLTGMGKDGAKGMLSMKKAGSYNIGQDSETSVVYGMPKAAYLAGAIDEQVPLQKMALEILQKCT